MLIDVLAHHARWSGGRTALVSRDGENFSYVETYNAIRSLATALRGDFPELMGKAPVAIALMDRQHHFLATIALEYLGIPSLPFVIPLDPGVFEALQHCAALIADQRLAGFNGRQIVLDLSWLERAERRSPDPKLVRAQWQGRELANLLVTSGSTGAAKCIRLSYQARISSDANRAWRYGFSPDTRYLMSLPISVSNVFISARAVLYSAGAIVFLNDQSMERAFDKITHTTLLPAHIRTILDALPDSYRHSGSMRVLAIGAALSAELRERAERILNAQVDSNYGCNELGGCALIDATGLAHLFPGIDMKVVDQSSNEVTPGTAGLIWMRSNEIADGYTDAASSRAHFVDGWFITGDLGAMVDHRTFRLLGRADSLMNLGGQKVAPEMFEAALLALGMARDVAVTSVRGAEGIEQFCVCLEQPLVSDGELLKRIGSVFGANTGHISVLLVDKIPRNATGKIQRREVHDMAVARAAG